MGRCGGPIPTGQPYPQIRDAGGGHRLFLAAGKQEDGRALFAPATGDGLGNAEGLGNPRHPVMMVMPDGSFPYVTAYTLPCTPLSR